MKKLVTGALALSLFSSSAFALTPCPSAIAVSPDNRLVYPVSSSFLDDYPSANITYSDGYTQMKSYRLQRGGNENNYTISVCYYGDPKGNQIKLSMPRTRN